MATQHYNSTFQDNGENDNISSLNGIGGSKSNALSNKITTVLSASYADSEIRHALGLLDERNTTNTAETRRNLRLDAQKELIDCNVAILDEFGLVAEQLRRVGAMIATLNDTCTQMRAHIASARSDSAPMLDEASTLVAGKRESETKRAVLAAFTAHFLVADEDLDVLTSSAVPIDERFFAVLARVQRIHADCEALLGSENERLGLEMMEQTARNVDAGFKKLYGWLQRALRGLDFEDPQISGSIRRALRVLAERPGLFQNCLEFLAEAREQTLSDAFQMALSGVGDAGGGAIEFSAHDLLRYLGDMLAWVHSTTVSEKESLEGLFIADADAINRGMKLGKASEPWLQDFDPANLATDEDPTQNLTYEFDGEQALRDLVSRSLTRIGTTLQERIDLAIHAHSHDSPLLLFKAQTLLSFYHALFAKLLGPTSPLTATIQTLEHSARDELYAVLDATAAEDEAAGVSWADDPLSAPVHATANLAALSSLLAVKPAAEIPTLQLRRLADHYLGPTRDFAVRVAVAEAEHAEEADQETERKYTDVQLLLALTYTNNILAFLRTHHLLTLSSTGSNAADVSIFPTAQQVRSQLSSALTDRLHAQMLGSSGVGALRGEDFMGDDDGEEEAEKEGEKEEKKEAFLEKLPEYADRLDAFLSDGYAEIVGRVKGVGVGLDGSSSGVDDQGDAGAEEEEDGEDGPDGVEERGRKKDGSKTGGTGIVEQATARFLRDLEEVLGRLAGMGEEVREAYPRTMEDVFVLLG